MTRPDLDALQALLDKATPGPWTAGEPIIGIPRFIVADCGPIGKVYPATNEISHGTTSMDDAKLIAAAVNALPDLLAYVRELEREIDAGKGAYAKLFRDTHAAALAMRERCAQACEKLAYAEHQTGKVDHNEQAWTRVCAAAVRALEP